MRLPLWIVLVPVFALVCGIMIFVISGGTEPKQQHEPRPVCCSTPGSQPIYSW